MRSKVDKRARSALFRQRLSEAMTNRAMSQSALARQTDVDRSTISQLLKPDATRLPNAQMIGECAAVLGVSADWLLGLTERSETAAEMLANTLSLTEASRALVDEQIYRWHREADGYKIRHVPAALPDMLKTRAMLEWEYAPDLGRDKDQAIAASENRMDWMRASQSDHEIALPEQELTNFMQAQGQYAGLPDQIRHDQIAHLFEITQKFYPRLRLYLFDLRRLYSAPVTIFGPLLAVVYIGRNYMAFRDSERVNALTEHFDSLIRESHISARGFPDYLTNTYNL